LKQLLIIEDCPFTYQGYKTILNQNHLFNASFKITHANTCDSAILCIKKSNYNIIFLDIQLPISKNEKFVSGEDLGLLIRSTQPNTKIVVITNISDTTRIMSIVNEIQPNAFIIKAKSDTNDLINAIKCVLNDKTYHCDSVSKLIESSQNNNNNNNNIIDDYDRQILYHLANGVKTKDLCTLIPLSYRAIEVRKAKLRALLNIKNSKNFNLIKAAKAMNYI
jgi:DNA-binding NarL/FixJ family response regulator